MATVAGLGSGLGSRWATRDTPTLLHAGVAGDRAMNAAKGLLGEALMQRLVARNVLLETHWSTATPVGAPNGIDGLFFKLDAMGQPRDMLIAEAKTYGSALGKPAIGPQMGQKWISHYLRRSSGTYSDIADAIQGGRFHWATARPDGVRIIEIPLAGGRTARAWQVGNEVHLMASDDASAPEIARQFRHMGRWMEAGATGDVSFRARVIRLNVVDGKHSITIQRIDPSTLKLDTITVKTGAFHELPPEWQQALKASFRDAFRQLGKQGDELTALVNRACEDPEFARTMQRRARLHAKVVSWANLVQAALIAGAVSALLSAAVQFAQTGRVELRAVLRAGVMSTGTAFIGASAGSLTTAQLLATPAGRSLLAALPGRSHALWARSLGASGGALVAIAAILVLQVGLGLMDRREAMWQLGIAGGSITAGAATTGAFFAAAWAFGTAGTSTTIGSLSGAAFVSAAKAWVAGGPLYAGGGGAALGGAIIAGTAVIAALAASLALTKYRSEVEEERARRLIRGRMLVTRARIARGAQLEWHTLA